jgi:DNA-binding HxlR family transcriptional regulator
MPATKGKRRLSKDPTWPAAPAIKKIGQECRVIIIKHLLTHPMRFNELSKIGIGIDPKTLARVLKYLESEGIIERNVLSSRPVAVQYTLTEKGRQLKPVIDSLEAWGERWIAPPN